MLTRRLLLGAALGLVLSFPLLARDEKFESTPRLVVENWLATARVGQGERHKNLVLYPVQLSSEATLADHLSLDEALRNRSLTVKEVSQSGSVNELLVNNSGKLPVYIMAGEILAGAKQDRVLQDDVWLPAQSGDVTVAAFCVERGRWTYQTPTFESSRPQAANIAVRATARESKDQAKVWDAVASTQSGAGYSESTNLGETYNAPQVKANLEGYLDAFRAFAKQHPEARGVVVQIGSRLLAADLFATRGDFVEKFPKLLPSYALEAAQAGGSGADSDSDSARRFLTRIIGASFTTVATPGQGTLVNFKSDDLTGQALVVGRSVVHLESFPGAGSASTVPTTIPIIRQYPPR
ncbi:MAG: DUF6569 family protein [Candidatus Eremiobacterota bacterium]